MEDKTHRYLKTARLGLLGFLLLRQLARQNVATSILCQPLVPSYLLLANPLWIADPLWDTLRGVILPTLVLYIPLLGSCTKLMVIEAWLDLGSDLLHIRMPDLLLKIMPWPVSVCPSQSKYYYFFIYFF
jgi:hypothetical protein